jgi:nucleoside-diphosphate-sugar epimerase
MILVVGATGVVGGMITLGLLEQGKEVRALVRRDSPSSQLVQQGLATSAETLSERGRIWCTGTCEIAEMEETSRTLDVPPTRLETFVREQVASQIA